MWATAPTARLWGVTSGTFYSDRAGQSIARTSEDISPKAWAGLTALLRGWIADGSLARAFPQHACSDGSGYITGVDENRFLDQLGSHVPELTGSPFDARAPQSTSNALDIIDFVAQYIDQPSRQEFHRHCGCQHFFFGTNESEPFFTTDALTLGQIKFQRDIDTLFARNGIAFTVGADLRIRRLGPMEARHVTSDFRPKTGDPELDALLVDAMTRFLSRSPADRQDALEKLWDGFERLKTLELGGDQKKRDSATRLLTRAAAGSAPFLDRLETESMALTKIGNEFRIRHHEHDKHALPGDEALDYVFTRLASFIAFLLRQTGRLSR
ncbi:hypothetical protein [Actinacidiphila oryziradicis]|uniref:Uncharacterized protein n=1 Tax=Actinacidiphila oryziradicis TaxID=2571141 RepID=A0A4U0T0T7_9ACTN|nr:hypothetical protein [Actinacidiphila oryziradicis]TKA06365.1 hypothetical protein FCI23_31755 [Actinacidiphila oryziradicis]